MAKASRGVQSIEISGRILKVMADAAIPLMLRDIAGAIGIPAGQAHPYLVSLRKLGLVEQGSQAGLYELGPSALRLALAHVGSRQPVCRVRDALPGIADDLGFGVTMSVWCSLGPIILRTAEVPSQPFTNLRAGSLYSLTTTASGRLFAAFKPWADVETVLQRQMIQVPATDPAQDVAPNSYLDRLELIRQERVSVTHAHPAPGISAISAPVFDGDTIAAAITAIGAATSLDIGPDSAIRARLVEIAAGFSVSQEPAAPEIVAPA